MSLPTNEQWEGWFLLGQEENSSSFSQPCMKNYLKLFSEQHITLKSCSRSARWTQELTVRMFQDLLLMLPSRAKLSCRVKIKIKRFMLSCYLIGHNWANRPYSQPLKYFPQICTVIIVLPLTIFHSREQQHELYNISFN